MASGSSEQAGRQTPTRFLTSMDQCRPTEPCSASCSRRSRSGGRTAANPAPCTRRATPPPQTSNHDSHRPTTALITHDQPTRRSRLLPREQVGGHSGCVPRLRALHRQLSLDAHRWRRLSLRPSAARPPSLTGRGTPAPSGGGQGAWRRWLGGGEGPARERRGRGVGEGWESDGIVGSATFHVSAGGCSGSIYDVPSAS